MATGDAAESAVVQSAAEIPEAVPEPFAERAALPGPEANGLATGDATDRAAVRRPRFRLSNAGIGLSDKRVFRSIDTGQTTTAAGRPPKGGNQTMLAAAPNGTLLVAASSGASFIYRNGGTTRWTTPAVA